jgi:hypothetical protein
VTPVLLVLKDTNIIWHVNRVFATSVCDTIQITVIKHELTKKQMKVKQNIKLDRGMVMTQISKGGSK